VLNCFSCFGRTTICNLLFGFISQLALLKEVNITFLKCFLFFIEGNLYQLIYCHSYRMFVTLFQSTMLVLDRYGWEVLLLFQLMV
jgi:hypothetical protein